MTEELRKIIDRHLKLGVIEPSSEGPWASPCLLVRKKDKKSLRLVIDFRSLNSSTICQFLRIPAIKDILDKIGIDRPQYISTFDLDSGFHQIPMEKESIQRTAFLTPFGKYVFKTMPQGLKNASSTFMHVMDVVLQNLNHTHAYIDDIITTSTDFTTQSARPISNSNHQKQKYVFNVLNS